MLKTVFTLKFPVINNTQFDLYAVIVDGNADVERVQDWTQKALMYNVTFAALQIYYLVKMLFP